MISVAEKVAGKARFQTGTKLDFRYIVMNNGEERFLPPSWSWSMDARWLKLSDGDNWRGSIALDQIKEMWTSYRAKLEADLVASL